MIISEKDGQRFWGNVGLGINGCWEWQAARDGNGYGNFCLNGRHYVASRLAYMLVNGEIKDPKI